MARFYGSRSLSSQDRRLGHIASSAAGVFINRRPVSSPILGSIVRSIDALKPLRTRYENLPRANAVARDPPDAADAQMKSLMDRRAPVVAPGDKQRPCEPEMERFGEFLFRHVEGIAAYCDHPVRFGVVEPINTTIKAVLAACARHAR